MTEGNTSALDEKRTHLRSKYLSVREPTSSVPMESLKVESNVSCAELESIGEAKYEVLSRTKFRVHTQDDTCDGDKQRLATNYSAVYI
jgi:hypothetical protein